MLVLVQSDPRGPFHAEMFAGLREVVDNDAGGAVSIYLEYLDRSRFNSASYHEELSRFLEAKYRDTPIGVIVGYGVGTLESIAPLRATVWANIPLVFGQVDESAYRHLTLPQNTTGNILQLELQDMVAAARSVVPGLKSVAIVGDALEANRSFDISRIKSRK